MRLRTLRASSACNEVSAQRCRLLPESCAYRCSPTALQRAGASNRLELREHAEGVHRDEVLHVHARTQGVTAGQKAICFAVTDLLFSLNRESIA